MSQKNIPLAYEFRQVEHRTEDRLHQNVRARFSFLRSLQMRHLDFQY